MASTSSASSQGETPPHQRVLVDWGQWAIKKHLSLEKVMPGLVKRKVVPNKVGKAIVKKNDTETLLAILKQKPVEDFVSFMEAVAETFPQCEDHRTLVNIMSNSLKRINLPHHSDMYKAIQQVVQAAEKQPVAMVEETSTSFEQPQPFTEMSPERESLSTSLVQGSDVDTVKPKSQSSILKAEEHIRSPKQDQQESAEPTQPSIEQHRVALSTAMRCPPDGFIKPPKSQEFTNKGGVFYCPAHGVTIDIPADAVPPDIDRFTVSMNAYMQGPFEFPEDIEVCTPIIWLGLCPSFEFVKDVTVKIPHCAVMEDESDINDLQLLRASDSALPVYIFSEILEADYSDPYYVVTKLRHFCSIGGGRKQTSSHREKRTRSGSTSKRNAPIRKRRTKRNIFQLSPELARQGSTPELVRQASGSSVASKHSIQSPSQSFKSSIEECIPHQSSSVESAESATHSPLTRQEALDESGHARKQQSSSDIDETVSYNEMYVAKCAPKQHAGRWTTTFLVSCSHPTGLLAILQAAERIYGEDPIYDIQTITATRNYLEFLPAEWGESGWKVCATKTPQVEIQEVTRIFQFSEDQTERLINMGLYPPRLCYSVDGARSSKVLQCKVSVEGAEVNGQSLYFMLTSDTYYKCCDICSHKKSSQTKLVRCCEDKLHTWSQLYPQASPIHQVLPGHASGLKHGLDPGEPDHRALIADISFQLTSEQYEQLVQLLEVSHAEVSRMAYDYPHDLAEQIYQILLGWAGNPSATFSCLLSAFKTLGIRGIELIERSSSQVEIDSRLDGLKICENEFIRDIGKEMGHRWKFVARFLGLSEVEIRDIMDADPQKLNEQSFQMLVRWRRLKGREATYGVLLKAIHRVFDHEPSSVCVVWWHAFNHVQNFVIPAL